MPTTPGVSWREMLCEIRTHVNADHHSLRQIWQRPCFEFPQSRAFPTHWGGKHVSGALSAVVWELTFGLHSIILGFMKFPGCSRGSRNSGTLCLVSCSTRQDPVVLALFRNRLVLLWHWPFVSTERDREAHSVWVPYRALFMFLK